MKTQQTPQNVAILALTDTIVRTIEQMRVDAVDARLDATRFEMNGAIGALLPVQERLASLQAQLAAVMALHSRK